VWNNVTVMTVALLMCALSILASPVTADAHKPLSVDAPNDSGFGSAKVIPDHRVSWAIYKELKAGSADYYTFEGKQGERFYAQMTIPKLEGLASFTPSLALVGPGVGSGLDLELGPGRLVQNVSFPVAPDGMESVVIEYGGPLPSAEFYEPFTQTTYWERQQVTIDSLPASGT